MDEEKGGVREGEKERRREGEKEIDVQMEKIKGERMKSGRNR